MHYPSVLLHTLAYIALFNFYLFLHNYLKFANVLKSQFLNTYSYELESHEVITDDGFYLTLHRIPPHSRTTQNISSSRPPAVLLVPCLVCSSMDWVSMGPKRSLAIQLTYLGYDVWLLNPRGSRYSSRHQTLNSSQKEFWDYSFHEKGYYDLPASIDYILNTKGLEKLTLIGYSEGSTAALVLPIMRPEYNKKLNLIVLMGPSVYMSDIKSLPFIFTGRYMNEIQNILNGIEFYGLKYSNLVSKAFIGLCLLVPEACFNFLQTFCGEDPDQLEMDYMMIMLSDKPSGISVKQIMHYVQEFLTDTFRQYDYGSDENIIHYGSPDPPDYNLSKISVPVATFYGKNDLVATVLNVEKLISQIPNIGEAHLIDYEYFNHMDFFAAKEVKSLLNDKLISVIEKYSPVEN